MDKLTTYRELIKRCLGDWEAFVKRARHNGTEIQHVFDEANGHYLLLQFGWNKDRRVYRTDLHVRLHHGKIWIEADETEEGIATALVRAGVPREDIVLAFHPPALRDLTEFAAV
jgi:hypothetical protein